MKLTYINIIYNVKSNNITTRKIAFTYSKYSYV